MMSSNVTRKELAVAVNEQLGVSQRNSSDIVDTVFAVLKDSLVGGESVKLVQFGTLTVRDKSPRRGRNPRTGESMTITKRKMISFRPSKQLRDRLNKKI
ncbi:MAG TPA: integration host factor subunit alpha [Desulfobulbaceae bacterium]|nr:integration host factor subunit alpha [Desulfobulbaceae bacterium]